MTAWYSFALERWEQLAAGWFHLHKKSLMSRHFDMGPAESETGIMKLQLLICVFLEETQNEEAGNVSVYRQKVLFEVHQQRAAAKLVFVAHFLHRRTERAAHNQIRKQKEVVGEQYMISQYISWNCTCWFHFNLCTILKTQWTRRNCQASDRWATWTTTQTWYWSCQGCDSRSYVLSVVSFLLQTRHRCCVSVGLKTYNCSNLLHDSLHMDTGYSRTHCAYSVTLIGTILFTWTAAHC